MNHEIIVALDAAVNGAGLCSRYCIPAFYENEPAVIDLTAAISFQVRNAAEYARDILAGKERDIDYLYYTINNIAEMQEKLESIVGEKGNRTKIFVVQ